MITAAQHGFPKPCNTKVISLLDSFTKLASQCHVVDMIYLDNRTGTRLHATFVDEVNMG